MTNVCDYSSHPDCSLWRRSRPDTSETPSGVNCRASCMAIVNQSLHLPRADLDMNGIPHRPERITTNECRQDRRAEMFPYP